MGDSTEWESMLPGGSEDTAPSQRPWWSPDGPFRPLRRVMWWLCWGPIALLAFQYVVADFLQLADSILGGAVVFIVFVVPFLAFLWFILWLVDIYKAGSR